MRYALPLLSVGLALATACGEADQAATGPETFTAPVYASATQLADGSNLQTHMSGREEVPIRATLAQGQAIFRVSEDGTELSYKLIVANIQNVLQSHIHNAPAGVNGPIVAWLYPPAPPLQLIPGRSQGILEEGVITDEDVIGLDGVAGLLEQIRAGNTYVNVHTSQFPPGEIRGQID